MKLWLLTDGQNLAIVKSEFAKEIKTDKINFVPHMIFELVGEGMLLTVEHKGIEGNVIRLEGEF